jgi:glycosyltransferase involved in cell wall biosynthesis
MTLVTLSIVVPVFNEEGNAVRLAHEIAVVFKDTSYEMIFVDDASQDATLNTLVAAKADLPALRVLHHPQNAGQSRAIRTGVLAAKGQMLGILDGDGQNDPADFPKLLDQYQAMTPLPGMVAGERLKRQDHWAKRLGSKLGNAIRRFILRDGINDAGCGLKVMARQTYLQLPFFDHQHRYMAALIIREGFKVVTLPVSHRPRQSGQSKYTNLGRLAVSIRDILGVMWLQSRSRQPGDIEEL